MAGVKEVHFFDEESNFIDAPDYNKYHKCFEGNPGALARGEVTPIYMYLEPAIRRIYEYNSQIKIIAILSDPVKR
jgi:hypothetical protein